MIRNKFLRILFSGGGKSEEKNEKKKFDYLDGMRGSLALSVLVRHGTLYYGLSKDMPFFWQLGIYYGVAGFFILSSFLLTHSLLQEMNACSTFKSVQLIVLKFFIRRLFRVYLPFLFVCSLIKGVSKRFIGMYHKYMNSWLSMITLQSTGLTHLWTVAPEVKYYLFIPLFVLITAQLSNRFSKLVWLMANIMLCFSIEYLNLFMLKKQDFELSNGHVLKTRFTTFYLGSILALAHDQILSKIDSKSIKRLKLLVGILTFLLFVKTLKYGSISYNRDLNEYEHFFKSSVHLVSIYLLMIVGDENAFTNMFRNSFLKMAGKYSFGLYLLHPMCLIEVSRCLGHLLIYRSELLVYGCCVSFLVGALFFHLIERPLIRMALYLCFKLDACNYFSDTVGGGVV